MSSIGTRRYSTQSFEISRSVQHHDFQSWSCVPRDEAVCPPVHERIENARNGDFLAVPRQPLSPPPPHVKSTSTSETSQIVDKMPGLNFKIRLRSSGVCVFHRSFTVRRLIPVQTSTKFVISCGVFRKIKNKLPIRCSVLGDKIVLEDE